METFSQLLNEYVHRSGISDAELARTIGVSRQTIFRWREGETGRPRHREDVLVIARKLRLTPIERDKLLLAAGFYPEEGVTTEARADAKRGEPREESTSITHASAKLVVAEGKETAGVAGLFWQRVAAVRYRWTIAALIMVLALMGGTTWWLNQGQPINPPALTPQGTGSGASLATPPAPGEILILVTHFANYSGGQVGYNVAGRLTQALQREIDDARLAQIRLEIWPHEVGSRDVALQAGQQVSATLVIYGEYDVGRVLVQFASPTHQTAFADPAIQQQVAGVPELSAAINSDLPQQVRSLALLALGQIYLNQQAADQARPLLIQARDHLKNDSTVDRHTWASANFYLGLAYHDSQPPDLDAAITAYTEAVAAWPEMLSSRLNRSAALEVRDRPGDSDLALADIEYITQAKPDWALAYVNRASIRLGQKGDKNLALAAADLDKALALDSSLPSVYLNRAYLAYEQDKPMSSLAPDLDKALALRPAYAAALNLYCWSYALEQQPDRALPYCQQAIAADPQPVYMDSRAIVYTQTGDYTAAMADFKAFAAWLEKQSNPAWQPVLARRRAWLEALNTGQNPLTPAVLTGIRHEFGK